MSNKYVPPSMRNRQQTETKTSLQPLRAPESPSAASHLPAPGLDMGSDPLLLQACVKACTTLSFEGLDVECCQILKSEPVEAAPVDVARVYLCELLHVNTDMNVYV